MFHILKDEEEIVAVLANVTWQQVVEAIAKVDIAFRACLDKVPLTELEERMCEHLGIGYSNELTDYNDVLVALLIDCGATRVEWAGYETVPELTVSAGRTEEEANEDR